ncbi:thioredoxin [Klebsiella huaxiensis]|uniref:Thioredoxin n=1 Tax=Klebsiella huaxiensis TaxID=2153354 RepID=A0ABT6EBI1_9ENTR|nr:thioredoxin [Klebsiella huaxiensis]MDG1642530.1 thioredoxin [Klebsiella huaxiensis]QBG08959.1 thioredoxin [Klebsiella huaxiensis]
MAIKELSVEEFSSEVLEAKLPVLIDFWAPWCSPCRSVSPVIDEIAQENEGKLKIIKVNVDEQPELAAQHGIRSIPFFKLFVRGEVVMEFAGVRSKSDFDTLISHILD